MRSAAQRSEQVIISSFAVRIEGRSGDGRKRKINGERQRESWKQEWLAVTFQKSRRALLKAQRFGLPSGLLRRFLHSRTLYRAQLVVDPAGSEAGPPLP